MRRNTTFLIGFLAAGFLAMNPAHVQAQSPSQNTAARTLFVDGLNFWDDGKLADAEQKFREALTKYPKAERSDRTSFYLITTLMKLGRPEEARGLIDNFDRNFPQSRWSSDVEELRLKLNGLPLPYLGWQRGIARPVPPPPPSRPNPSVPASPRVPMTVTLQQEVLNQILLIDVSRGLTLARERLRFDPSDPAVVSNLGTIANSDTVQAMSFLVNVAGNVTSNPNVKATATFYLSRKSDKAMLGRAFIDVLKDKDGTPVVAEVMSRFEPAERRVALGQIAQSNNAERTAMLERVYRSSTNPQVRSQIVEAVGSVPEPEARTFITDVVRNAREVVVRNAALQALRVRKDVDAKTWEDLLNAPPAKAAK